MFVNLNRFFSRLNEVPTPIVAARKEGTGKAARHRRLLRKMKNAQARHMRKLAA